MDRLGPSHVCQWHEPVAWHGLHDDDYGDRGSLRNQSLQLARHALGRDHSPHLADALRFRLRVEFLDRRSERRFYGFHAGRYLYPRYLLHRRTLSLRGGGNYLRLVCGGLLLVSQDVRAQDERRVGKDPLRINLYIFQRRVFSHAFPWRGRAHAAHLQSDPVRVPTADAALERVHHNQRFLAGGLAIFLPV